MRRHLISCILTLILAATAVNAQSFSSFILSGRADNLAMGDITFRTPDLAAHRVDAAVSFGKWAPQQLNFSALQAGGFLALSEGFGLRLDYRTNLFPEFTQIDVNGNEKGTFKPSEQRILLGASLKLGDNLYIDVNGKYFSTDLAGNNASAFGGDVAFHYVKDGLTLGLKGADLGTKYSFGENAWKYLDKMRELCDKEGIKLLMIKAPSLYPHWYDEWEAQLDDYAAKYDLPYINFLELTEEIGIDYTTDTYDAGLHMNLSGAEKCSRYIGAYLTENMGVSDRRGEEDLQTIWAEKRIRYDAEIAEQKVKYGIK